MDPGLITTTIPPRRLRVTGEALEQRQWKPLLFSFSRFCGKKLCAGRGYCDDGDHSIIYCKEHGFLFTYKLLGRRFNRCHSLFMIIIVLICILHLNFFLQPEKLHLSSKSTSTPLEDFPRASSIRDSNFTSSKFHADADSRTEMSK